MPAGQADVDAIVAAVEGRPMQPADRDNRHALYDLDLPAHVRAFLAINLMNGVCTSAVEEAGYMPRLYGTWNGERVRVVMVSTMGDIGISRDDVQRGYFERCSIYDLTDYAEEMNPDAPAGGRGHRVWTLVSSDGRWVRVTEEGPGGFVNRDGTRVHGSSYPILYHSHGAAAGALHKADPYGLRRARVAPGILTIERE